jgi:hypothetical protein
MALESLVLPAVTVFGLAMLFWFVSNGRDWRNYEVTGESSRSASGRFLAWLWSSPTAWMLVFVVVSVGIAFTAILAVSKGDFVSMAAGTVLPVVLGGIIGLMGTFLFFGTYFSVRSRGAANSMAAVLSALLMGFVVLGVVALRLAGVL